MLKPTVVLALLLAPIFVDSGHVNAADQGPSFDCSKSRTQLERLICKTPALSLADMRMADAYALATTEAKPEWVDKIREAQRLWLQNRPNLCPPAASDGQCADILSRAMVIRTAWLIQWTSRSREAQKQREELLAKLTLPDTWWGWAPPANEPEGSLFLMIGQDGDLYVDRAGPTNFTIRNVISGQEVASSTTSPEALHSGANEGFMKARLGLAEILGTFLVKPAFDVEQKSITSCPRVDQYLIGSKVYIYKWLPRSQRLGDGCDTESARPGTYDFQSLYAAPFARLADGTILAIVDDKWLVRFNPDLSSPFFHGRSDLVLTGADVIDPIAAQWENTFPKSSSYDVVIKQVHDALVRIGRDQTR